MKNIVQSVVFLVVVFALMKMQSLSTDHKIDPNWQLNEADFSYENVIKKITKLAQFGHRGVGSEGHTLSREYIVKYMRKLGYEVEVQASFECAVATCAPVANIIASRAGSKSKDAVMISAHYDSVEASPGISDNGVAIGILMEAGRILMNSKPDNTVIFLFSDAEEVGALGAKVFAKEHPLFESVKVVINADSMGTTGLAYLFETGANNSALIRTYSGLDIKYNALSALNDIYDQLPNYTDFTVFKKHGLTGLNFGLIENSGFYHTADDNIEQLDPASINHLGKTLVGLTQSYMMEDFNHSEIGESAYSDIFGAVMLILPFTLLQFIAVVSFGLFIWCTLRYRTKTSLVREKVKAVFVFPLFIIITVLFNIVASSLLSFIVTDGQLMAEQRQTYFMLWVLVSVLLTMLLVKRFIKQKAYQQAQLFWWLMLSLITVFLLPKTSIIFVLPTLLLVCALLCSKLLDKKQLPSSILVGSAAILSLYFFIKVALTLDLAYGQSMSVAFSVFSAFGIALFMPLLTRFENQKYKYLYPLALALSILFVAYTPVLTDDLASTPPNVVNFLKVDDRNKNRQVLIVEDYGVTPEQVITENPNDYEQDHIYPWLTYLQRHVKSQPLPYSTPSYELKACDITSGKYVYEAVFTPTHKHGLLRMFFPTNYLPEQVEVNGKALTFDPSKDLNTELGYRPVVFGLAGQSASFKVTSSSELSMVEVYLVEERLLAGNSLNGPFLKESSSQLQAFYGDREAVISKLLINIKECQSELVIDDVAP
ncbi:hypothetical protein CJF42_03490 [Pseudoalteromonas sp. NBT06-2]|uniref:M28 family peptidase n=1 Tax=Pseudoalteromonas sp. NBT06-2 TaxID=2025950 RepID=UPI000BA56919|nr:M28 family peptidase [Pseudoalteromonas sp. NBT06-2]PAJ75707.1 hypothetical protein CJF42_03490 [Pseudoalteromonas sp. NBT06-2]